MSGSYSELLGIQFRRSPDGEQLTELNYDFATGKLSLIRARSTDTDDVSIGSCECEPILVDGEALELTVYLDNSVIEVYANDRLSLTSRIYPSRDDANGLRLYCAGGGAAADVSVWRMGSIWQGRE